MAKNKEDLKNNYDSIETLSDMEHIRKRPGMYVGSTQSLNGENSNALIQLFQETISNSIDEAYSGFGDIITATIHEDNSVTIADKGRGIPYGENGQSAINAFTVLNSSGKFNSDSYANSLGTNGVGIKCVTALSKKVEVEAKTSKLAYKLEIVDQKVVKNDVVKTYKKENNDTGTTITFWPDKEIFDVTDWNDKILINKIEQSAFLTPKVKFVFIDERKKDENGNVYQKEWYSENGMSDYVEYISQDETLIKGLNKPISFKGTTEDKDKNEISVEGALIFTENFGETVMSFVNGGPTIDGGPHVDGAHQAILKAFNDYSKDEKLLKGNEKFEMADVTEGLIVSLLVKLPENIMMFESQSKTKLSTVAAKPAVFDVLYKDLSSWLYDNKKIAKAIVENMKLAKDTRMTLLKERKEKKQANKNKNKNKLFVSEKLRRASGKDPELLELLIGEGDSACIRGSVKVYLADGTNPTIKEMTERFNNGEKLYVYSNNFAKEDNDHELDDDVLNKNTHKDNGLRVVPIEWVGVTRKNAELVRVYIDNDTYIDCTPDHKFLMLDGTYKEAQYLQPKEILSTIPIKKNNHCVVKVEKLDIKEDVYDIKVPHIHNFCLANDVFVHNCGSITKTRDARYQSVFPIRGKILNVQDTKLLKVLSNEELSTIASILTSDGGIGKDFDIDKLQYNKIIIASDQDSDGFHIRALLMTAFYNLFPGLIENGHVYIVDSPLFINSWYVKGERNEIYTYSIEEQIQVEKDLRNKKIKYDVQRNKGLGELSLDAAEKSLTNPKTRKLTRVTSTDAVASKKALALFMGDKSDGRKQWIAENVDFNEKDELDLLDEMLDNK